MSLISGVEISEGESARAFCSDGETRSVGRLRCGPDVAQYISGNYSLDKLPEAEADVMEQWYVKRREGVACHAITSETDRDVVWLVCSPESFEGVVNEQRSCSVMYAPEVDLLWSWEPVSPIMINPRRFSWVCYRADDGSRLDDSLSLEFVEIPDEVVADILTGSRFETELVAREI